MLLDYRNYLELEIEVQRGADGWLRAESGALSTGEAIGTGQAILLMVLISWEEESPPSARQGHRSPAACCSWTEAARLDGKSIATLFELCERQDMQLLIAAPENISPGEGHHLQAHPQGAGQARACACSGAARLWLRRRQAHRRHLPLTGADGSDTQNGGFGPPVFHGKCESRPLLTEA